MIYAFINQDENQLYISAADSVEEYQNFTKIHNDIAVEADAFEIMKDKELFKLLKYLTILQFDNENNLNQFVSENSINCSTINSCQSAQKRMISLEEFNDDRTIAEINDIEDNDPWDNRSEQQKQQDEESGDSIISMMIGSGVDSPDRPTTGDSWARTSDGDMTFDSINATTNSSGEIIIGDITATKGFFDNVKYHLVLTTGSQDDYDALLTHIGLIGRKLFWSKHDDEGIVINISGNEKRLLREYIEENNLAHTIHEVHAENTANIDENWIIADDDVIDIYFRVDVVGSSLVDIDSTVKQSGTRPSFKTKDINNYGCWLAYVRKKSADQVLDELVSNGFNATLVEVDEGGNRILEEGSGAIVLDSNEIQEESPAPWNDKANEFAAMSEQEQKKCITPDMFIYTLYDTKEHGRKAYITPKTYFYENEKMWDGDIPFADKLLPAGFIRDEKESGLYVCKTLDARTANHVLSSSSKIEDSLALAAHINLHYKKYQNNI